MSRIRNLLVCVAGLLVTGSAVAATSNGNMAVSATVQSNCRVDSATMAFGTYVPGSGNLDVNGLITVRCIFLQFYSLGVGTGIAPGATETTRRMTSGTNQLAYQLFRNNGRNQHFGQLAAGDRMIGIGFGMGIDRNHTIYGRIPDSGANLSAAAGSYSDTVLVTINY